MKRQAAITLLAAALVTGGCRREPGIDELVQLLGDQALKLIDP